MLYISTDLMAHTHPLHDVIEPSRAITFPIPVPALRGRTLPSITFWHAAVPATCLQFTQRGAQTFPFLLPSLHCASMEGQETKRESCTKRHIFIAYSYVLSDCWSLCFSFKLTLYKKIYFFAQNEHGLLTTIVWWQTGRTVRPPFQGFQHDLSENISVWWTSSSGRWDITAPVKGGPVTAVSPLNTGRSGGWRNSVLRSLQHWGCRHYKSRWSVRLVLSVICVRALLGHFGIIPNGKRETGQAANIRTLPEYSDCKTWRLRTCRLCLRMCPKFTFSKVLSWSFHSY